MPRKRNKFLTIVFSFLPGAGHMFMGFMKMGLSLMTLFFMIIFLSSWMDFGPLMFIVPILCFYSFFDCICKCYASDSEFAQFKDHYLFADSDSDLDMALHGKGKLIFGVLLILIGVKLFWDSFVHYLRAVVPDEVYGMIITGTNLLPRIVVGVLIVVLGVFLIVGKRRRSDSNA